MAKLDDLIQQKQQRDEDWKAKKTAEREELRQLSDDAVMRVTSEPNAYLRYLDTQAINPQYSAANVMLAMAQNPDITYINSLENWGRLGRSVNREETGLKIRVSDPYVKDGRQYHGYKIGRVFDVTQTHGKAVPAPLTLRDNTPEMEAALSRLLDSAGVPVVTDAAMYQDAFYDPKAQRITVSTRLSDSKTFAALAREIVHAGIHDRGRYPYYSREDCAMDAECVSYMLCRNFSIDVPQPNVSRVGQAFDGMEAQDRRSVVDSLQKYFRIAGVCRHDRNDQSRNGSQFFDMHYFLRYHASTYQLNMEAAYEQNEKHRTYPLRSCAGAYPKFSRGAGSGIAESDTVDQPHPCGR